MMQADGWPDLLPLEQAADRLAQIFPASFPDRGPLVGAMAARVVYVFLYGGFIEGSGRFLRPSHVYLFTAEQARSCALAERAAWLAASNRPGFRPPGLRWYADNSRESIRDDLMRNRLLRLGLIAKRSDITVAPTSSKPVYFMRGHFARLFDPRLSGQELVASIKLWQRDRLDPATLQRMALRAEGALRSQTDLDIDLPDGQRLRVAGGPSSLIAKALIEHYAPKAMRRPAVLWLSSSDRKAYPQFQALAARVGLDFDLHAELPDLVLADLEHPLRVVFCEIVATDGAITEGRKQALLAVIRRSRVPVESVHFLTAFDERSGSPFRKNAAALAVDTDVWFRTEPGLILHLRRLPASDPG